MIVALMIIITNSIFSLAKTWRVFRKYTRFPASVLEMSLRFSTRPDPGDGRKSSLLLACINHFLLKYLLFMHLSLETNTFPPHSSTPGKPGAWMKILRALNLRLALRCGSLSLVYVVGIWKILCTALEYFLRVSFRRLVIAEPPAPEFKRAQRELHIKKSKMETYQCQKFWLWR